ncbi:MAG: pseudouridine synthase [Rhizobiaceae bacterium]
MPQKPDRPRKRRELRGAAKPDSQAALQQPRERIAKRIARSGMASRREAEAMITAGRVKVNGNILSSPAFNVGPGDIILIDGQRLPERERTRLFLFHKPSGTITTNRDPEGRQTIFDVLPADLPRLMTVGRLDFTTEGLLLLTNDGGLARVLELPSTGWLRRYRVRVHGDVDERALEDLKHGVAVDGVLYGAIDASLERKQGTNAWLTVALREGKNREIKKVLGSLGLDVTRLIRVSYGPFQLGSLEPGKLMELKGRTLREQLGERLIAEAGADFESAISKPFSNKQNQNREKAQPGGREKGGGDGKSFREQGLDRLQTQKPGMKSRRDKDNFSETAEGDTADKRKSAALPRSRASNVWMAPGARPLGAKARKKQLEKQIEKKIAGKGDNRVRSGSRSGNSAKSGQSTKKNADRRR